MLQVSPTSRPTRPRSRAVTALALAVVALAGCSAGTPPEIVRTSTPDSQSPSAPAAPTSTPSAGPSGPGSAAPGSPAPATSAPGGQAGKGLGKPVTVSGVTVSLADLRSVAVKGRPAVSLTLKVRNGRAQGVSLGGARVRLEHAGVAAPQDPSSSPVAATVGAGKTVEGTYVFVLAPDARDQVTVTVSSTASGPLTFNGPAPAP